MKRIDRLLVQAKRQTGGDKFAYYSMRCKTSSFVIWDNIPYGLAHPEDSPNREKSA